ncbi:tRNA preQ1(34) S-adenosylmethionine ribosyltransferase-isomerase QueA [Thermoproteota archaeon]
MKLSDFDYVLPNRLIAQKPIRPRDHSKLMVLQDNNIEHRHFYDITDYFKKGDVLVINETKVSRAKIIGKKPSGSIVEVILTKKIKEDVYECRVKGTIPKVGNRHTYKDGLKGKIIKEKEGIFTILFNKKITKSLTKNFELPTPPYVDRKIKKESEYQTTFSKKEGSVAAPTAGFHFTPEILRKLKAKGVKIVKICLHIDFGTFMSIKDVNVTGHKMHEETFEISNAAANNINHRKGRLFVVGTTSLRALEASTKKGQVIPQKSATNIFIYPGYRFKNRIDGMITNFHFPKSTLLLLVSALAGRKQILDAYKVAVKKRYRFYSFGDAMLLLLNSHPQ